MYSDLHCHPTGRNFPYFSNFQRSINSKEAHPWVIRNSKRRSLRKGKRATHYDKSDFGRIVEGKVKLVFAALYPFEHGFFNQIYDKPLGNGTRYSDYFDLEGSPPEPTVALLTGNTSSRIRYIRQNDFDYWKELIEEFDFIGRKSGVPQTVQIKIDQSDNPDDIEPRKTDVTGTYFLLAEDPETISPTVFSDENRSFRSKNQVNLNNKNETYVILTIEGMHALSMKNQAISVSKATLMDRIKQLKQWDPPIFFITFAHHFNNNLCSHAHSMPRIDILGDWNPDQRKNMNFWGNKEGFKTTKPEIRERGFSDLGMEALLELLSIKKSGKKLVPKTGNGRRILIDTKHMSASSRLEFYDKVVKPYNRNNPGDIIPVIASHSAYSGDTSLKGLIKRYDNEEDDFSPVRISDFYPDYGFNPWNINLSDEDIHMIVETRGLLGLNFDERVLGASKSWKKKYKRRQPTDIFLMANNIIGMAEACRKINKHKYIAGESNYTFWDAITIGSDFNGVVDPVDKYPTAEQFGDFESHIKTALEAYPDLASFGINANNIKKVIRKMCFDNTWNFVKKHF